MKRIRIAGLCLVAAFAFSALAASSAYAGEYGECVKAPTSLLMYKLRGKPKTQTISIGKYLTKDCEILAPEPGPLDGKVENPTEENPETKKIEPYLGPEGKYEWKAVKAEDKPFMDASGMVKLVFITPEKLVVAVVCKKSTSIGELLGWQRNVEHIAFEKCLLAGKPCWNVGVPNKKSGGTIVTFVLDTYLMDHGTEGPDSEEPKEDEVWNEFESSDPEWFPYLAAFHCKGEPPLAIGGAVSGVFTPVSKMARYFTLTFEPTIGEQSLFIAYYDEEIKEWVPFSRAILTGRFRNEFSSYVEINPCNEQDAKAEGKNVLTCRNEEALPYEVDEFDWVDELPSPYPY